MGGHLKISTHAATQKVPLFAFSRKKTVTASVVIPKFSGLQTINGWLIVKRCCLIYLAIFIFPLEKQGGAFTAAMKKDLISVTESYKHGKNHLMVSEIAHQTILEIAFMLDIKTVLLTLLTNTIDISQ